MDSKTLNEKLEFIEEYKHASNAATGSKYDANANVTQANIATLQTELGKKDLLELNRALTKKYLKQLYGEEAVESFEYDLKHHNIYSCDETSIFPYCVSMSLYPFLLNGLRDLGGSSGAPQHTNSYIGGLINLIFLVAGQFSGAVSCPEAICAMDHYLRKDFGQDYIDHLDEKSEFGTLRHRIEDWFQQFVYTINQPAGARNYQSPFTNIAYFDKYYFESIFKDYIFPDGDEPCWETTKVLQKMFMKWFNKERTKEVLTFPVETANLLCIDGKPKDEEMADFFAEMWSEGHSFFMYQSDSVDSLASCCRLRSGFESNVFSFTLGAGGIQTGSKKVIVLNLNRITQDWYNNERNTRTLSQYVEEITLRVHKYLNAWNQKLWDDYNAGILTVYKAGYIDLDKQYLTVGVNAFVESAEFLATVDSEYNGIKVSSQNEMYQKLARDIIGTIRKINTNTRTEHCK